jgi:hypothetical protein
MSKNFRIRVMSVDTGWYVEITSGIVKPPLVYTTVIKTIDEESLKDAYYSALTSWEKDFGIGQHNHTFSLTKNEMYTDMRLHAMCGNNWVVSPPPFRRNVRASSQDLIPPPDWWVTMLQNVDVARFPQISRDDFKRYVWFGNRFEETRALPLSSLQFLVTRRFSLANYLGADSIGPIVTSATDGLYPRKVPLLIGKYAKDVHIAQNDPFIRKCLLGGVHLLPNIMGTYRYFGTQVFVYSEEELFRMPFPGTSSAGLRPGASYNVGLGGHSVRVLYNGKKRLQAPYAFNRVASYINDFKIGKTPLYPEVCCKIAFKYEIVDSMWTHPDKRAEKYLKCREFFIPHFCDFVISVLVFGFRMMIERGNTICVGFKWWHGGAHTFATELGYGRDDITYGGGDIKGQDYTTPHYMLQLFIASTIPYIDPKSPDYELFMYMLRQAGDHLVAKYVNFDGAMWRWVIGTMPSGHYTTSHANSWILAVYWWAYVYGVHLRHPRARILVKVNGILGVNPIFFVRFKVYGDNHVVALSKNVRPYLCYADFVTFVEGLGIRIHDIQMDVPLLSVPDSMGGLKVKGIVFLKRYLVETNFGSKKYVLPYKQWIDIAPKIAWGNSPRRNEYDYACALAGLAWDSMGTNGYVYNVIAQLHAEIMARIFELGLTPYDVYMSTYVGNEEELRKRSKKLAIPESELVKFPTRKQLLQRHTYDIAAHSYRRAPASKGCLWSDDLPGLMLPNAYYCN